MSPSTIDLRIRGLRPRKPVVDPAHAHGSLLELERRPDGRIERALTVFLAGAECAFTCSFCDLWRWTVDGRTPVGALPAQLAEVLRPDDPSGARADRLKLYNASNFFDPRAVPIADRPRLAELAAAFAGVTVESHARTIGPSTLEFSRCLAGRLEVAMGLETVHPVAAAHLNKRLDLKSFERATSYLTDHEIDVRVFVLLGAPYVPADESVEWTVRATEHAARCGASVVSIIPVRGGNGEMERLVALGAFTPPTLAQLEMALDRCLAMPGCVVTADLWDAERLPACGACRAERIARLQRINGHGLPEPRSPCSACCIA